MIVTAACVKSSRHFLSGRLYIRIKPFAAGSPHMAIVRYIIIKNGRRSFGNILQTCAKIKTYG